jgi:hypothetical protein
MLCHTLPIDKKYIAQHYIFIEKKIVLRSQCYSSFDFILLILVDEQENKKKMTIRFLIIFKIMVEESKFAGWI